MQPNLHLFIVQSLPYIFYCNSATL